MFSVENINGYKICIPSNIKCYDVIEKISKSSNFVVLKVKQHFSNKIFAAKVIPKIILQREDSIQTINNEVSILRSCRHENIIRCFDSFDMKNSKNQNLKIIIFEYCSQGNLFDYINNQQFKDENEKKKMMRGIIQAVSYLHEKGIPHCNIKMESIWLDDDFNVKLSDFGFPKITNKMKSSTYSSPEVKREASADFFKSDIWSVAITLYAIETKTFPYKNKADAAACRLDISMEKEDLKRIIMKCLQKNPNDRPSANDLLNEDYFSCSKETGNVNQVAENMTKNEIEK